MNDSTALPHSNSNSVSTWLWNPFRLVAGGPALGIGLLLILAAGALAILSRTHFDGVLDTHVGAAAPYWVFLSYGLINWICLAGVLWIAGAILRGPTGFRAIDLFGTQALARWPFLIISLACFIPPFQTMTEKLTGMTISAGGIPKIPEASAVEWAAFSLVTLVMLLMTIWFVALAWKSFRTSCDAVGWLAIVLFVVGIIVAEILSKLVIIKIMLPQIRA